MISYTDHQRDYDWFRSRLGNFTGSRISELIGKPRTKGEEWTDKAKTYIATIEGQRSMNPMYIVDDELFEEYLQIHTATSKYMDFGTEQEEFARSEYERVSGNKVEETGMVLHPTIKNFASSPDGLIDSGKGCIEIKCPKQETFVGYRTYIHDGDDLLKYKKEYAYQIQAHMMCTGAEYCDFICYCVF
ncbi:MAG: YqaJ viral recombinase family protein, partial [Bacteroidaceae bacterium]|nr:YqaJ viral recombinase family protein [Bacteroidaceae bacterium]